MLRIAQGAQVLERSLDELAGDPERADRLLLGRRRVLAAAGLHVLGAAIPYARFLPVGVLPVALAETTAGSVVAGKPGLTVLNDRPLNMETPAHLLDDDVTPVARLFVRNNGLPPEQTDAATWTLEVHGEACLAPRTFSIAELKRDFDRHTCQLQLECGGNGRAEFRPPAAGNQWTTGAIGCPVFSGVRLRDVLHTCGLSDAAVYIAYRGADRHLSGDPDKAAISRGVPVRKALEDESLIAFEMNGAPIPAIHGGPLRMVCGGWPGSVSGKWLREILVRDRVHDGAKMGGASYRVPCEPVAPGETPGAMCIIESMPVKSLITAPRSGIVARLGEPLEVRGHAWAGDRSVRAVHTSLDFGATWQPARLHAPPNRLAWQRWQTRVAPPSRGYFEIWARATDDAGISQPMVLPGWNPRGYLNNATHRIAVRIV